MEGDHDYSEDLKYVAQYIGDSFNELAAALLIVAAIEHGDKFPEAYTHEDMVDSIYELHQKIRARLIPLR